MAEADHSAVWSVTKALQGEIKKAVAAGDSEMAGYFQRRLDSWVLRAIAGNRAQDPAALAAAAREMWQPADPSPEREMADGQPVFKYSPKRGDLDFTQLLKEYPVKRKNCHCEDREAA